MAPWQYGRLAFFVKEAVDESLEYLIREAFQLALDLCELIMVSTTPSA
jgi:hypothetical protein